MKVYELTFFRLNGNDVKISTEIFDSKKDAVCRSNEISSGIEKELWSTFVGSTVISSDTEGGYSIRTSRRTIVKIDITEKKIKNPVQREYNVDMSYVKIVKGKKNVTVMAEDENELKEKLRTMADAQGMMLDSYKVNSERFVSEK